MTLRIQTTVDSEMLTPRGHAKIMKEINKELGDRHQRRRVKKHFERNAETNPVSGGYRYRRRTDRTQAIKRAEGIDPLRPNFQTGYLRQQILANSIVRATQYLWSWESKGTFKIREGQVAGKGPKHVGLPPWQRRELEAITPEEEEQDTVYMSARYRGLAEEHPEFKRKRRRKVG